jgi:hypothetical protein
MTIMKSHFAEETDDASKHSQTATEQTRREHLPPSSLLGNLAVFIVLLIAFVTLVQLIQRPPFQALQADTLVIPGQPIWVLSNPPKRPVSPSLPQAEQKAAEQIKAPKPTP